MTINVDTQGFFLGGVADRQDRLRKLSQKDALIGQRDRSLEQTDRTIDFNMAQEQQSRVDQNLNDTFGRIKDTIDGIVNIGGDAGSPEARAAIRPLIESAERIEQLAQQNGLKVGTPTSLKVESLMQSTGSLKQRGRASGEAQAAADRVQIDVGTKKDPNRVTVSSPKPPKGFRFKDNGDLEFIPGGPEDPAVKSEDKESKLSTDQRKVATFAVRMENSSGVIDAVGDNMVQFGDRISGSGLFPQGLKSDDRQKFEQASRDFINAVLRRESGAAIGKEEFASANLQYLPVPGDSEAVLEQKRRNRDIVLTGFKAEAGGAFDEIKGTMPSLNVKIGDREFPVGHILTNTNGQRALVEQDGTLTILD